MLLRYFYDAELSQASYLVGCPATGDALIVDPARDITPYLQVAAQENLRIRHVAETHIHADFVSGGRELAARTGASLYLSQMGDANWQYGYAQEPNVILVRGGDRWMVGNLRLEVMHTPGHTPEHIALIVTDTRRADQPVGIFTGDFLFVGDVGRPDLLEGLTGDTVNSKEVGARHQFQSIQRIKQLPDYLQVWPGHGAGSACGKALGAVPSTTLGYEKLFNPAFQFNDEDQFVAWLLADQPEIPRYFAQMKKVNKAGPALLATLPTPTRVTRRSLEEQIAAGDLVIDLRPAADYRRAYLPGTINIPETGRNFSTYVGWFVDYNRPLYLILPDAAEVGKVLGSLQAIGVDQVAGFAGPDVITAGSESMPIISTEEVAARQPANGLVIVDVRGQNEYREQHIAGARNIPLGFLPQSLDQLPHDDTIILHCSSGYRSQIAASLLRAKGFDNVMGLHDSKEQWSELLETVAGV
ncbi:MAG: MBL fold metallo-hydrolase [Caldilineaceae bacterium]|nr:MBL fold metallo-hydrolase [Caldilineaceae bacterium]